MTFTPDWQSRQQSIAAKANEEISKQSASKDWDYWGDKPLGHAATIIAAGIANIEPAHRQQFIRDTLNTVEAWLRAEPTP